MKLNFHPEICCDECCEVVHNHFDCPACGKLFAETDMWDALHELLKEAGDGFKCGNCNARFVLVSKGDPCEWWNYDNWDFKAV